MEATFLNAVIVIAAGASVVKFALFEWEGVVQAWRHVRRLRRSTQVARRRRSRSLRILTR